MNAAAQAIRRRRHDAGERPFIVIRESTRACPPACPHCRAEAVPGRNPREPDTTAAKDLLHQVAAFGQPAPLFVITGGDPFQRPDPNELVAYGREAGVRVAVSPSGTPALTAERLRELHAAGAVGLSLGLDGSTAAIHDTFRGVPGVFRWTLDAWDTARALDMKVRFNTTVARHNPHDLPGIVRLVAEHGAMLWSAFFLVPTGRGRTLGALTTGEVEDVLNFVHDVGPAVPAKTTEAHHFRRVALQRQVLAATGDPYAEEPWCGYVPGSFPRSRELAALLAGPRDAEEGPVRRQDASRSHGRERSIDQQGAA
ncbi:hypothetical protein GCM10010415_29320 [Streptomyces atrovirens]|uniref:Radical SAM protein n=1 Tax=Streptomyces atrovirens TaxID=285556 RepID=A0ABW0DTH0_9ACTN